MSTVEMKIVQQVIWMVKVKGGGSTNAKRGYLTLLVEGEGKAPVLRGSVLCPM